MAKRKRMLPQVCLILWVAVLVVLGVYYLGFASRDSVYSEEENRTLSGFPAVTVDNVLTGNFGKEFEEYLLDHFPGRNKVISVTNKLESLLSFASLDEYLLIAEGPEDPLVDSGDEIDLDALLNEFNNAASATQPSETTPPVTDPPATEEVTLPPTEAPTEPGENPPIEEKPEALPEDFPEALGVYLDIGSGEERISTFGRNRVVAATAVLNKFAQLLPENGKVMFTVGPASYLIHRFVNAEEKVRFHSTWDEVVNALSDDNVYAFDTPEILSGAIQEGKYVSFRTDNHWTPYGAYLVYRQMAARAGKELCSYEEDFDITVEESFRGTYYRDKPAAYMNVEPDTLELLMPKIGVEYRQLTGPDTYKVIDFLNFDAVKNDRYTVYLCGPGGPWRYVQCDNDETENCLVVTDSFGLTVIPFLTSNYNQIHYYDARYYNKRTAGGTVAELIEKYNIHDVYVIIADFHSFNSSFLLSDVNYHLTGG